MLPPPTAPVRALVESGPRASGAVGSRGPRGRGRGAARRRRFGTEAPPLGSQVAAVEAAFAGLSFEIRTVEPRVSFETLASGGLDMVFAYDSPLLPMAVSSDLRVATVTDMPWWVALSHKHRLAGSDRVSLRDLATDAWFARPADTALYRITVGS